MSGATGAAWGIFKSAVIDGTSGVTFTGGVILSGGVSTGAGGTVRVSGAGSTDGSAGLCHGKYLQLLKMQRQPSAKTALFILVYTGFTVMMTQHMQCQ